MANRSKKMTNQQKFEQFLKDKGFIVSPNYAVLSLVPHYYKTDAGSHALISGIGVSMFTGIDTKPGDLGCVCFFYTGTLRLKYHRYANQAELKKKTSIFKSAEEAIKAFDVWRKRTSVILAEQWFLIQ
jgi:hypothetical protein